MSFDNREIDDKKLMEDIDSLENNIDYIEKNDEDKVIYDKEKRKNIIFVILLVVVILAYLGYEQIIKKVDTSSFKKDSFSEKQDDQPTLNEEKFNRIKKNVVIESTKAISSNDLIINVKNNNDEAIYDFDLYTIFYDENNNPISVKEKIMYYVGAGKETYTHIFDCPEEYDRVETIINKDYYYSSEIEYLSDSIKYDVEKDGKNIVIKGKNESKKKIEQMKFEVVFFDGIGNIIGIDELYEFDLDKNKNYEIESFGPYDEETNEPIEYSNYKVNFSYAY